MKLPRRKFLHLAAGATGFPALPRFALAQVYPARPVHIVVGFQGGTASDIIARFVGEWLSERLGQQFVVENRPGAAGNVAAEAVARGVPDGYTLLLVAAVHSISATLYKNLNFSFARDIAPVASIVRTTLVMEVSPSFPSKTVPDFIAYAKANPGKIAMASPGIGTIQHIAGELFQMMTDTEMVHVPYRGAPPALMDLISGRVQVMFDVSVSSIEYIRSGKLRPLAVSTKTRLEALPDVPVIADFVPGYEASGWIGLGAPKNTPAQIVKKLNDEVNSALTDPKFKVRLADLGGQAFASSPTEFGEFIAGEIEKFGKVIKFADIKPE
jgi:tripartite-type tricarboxylate transporter receptor subunit TctC